MSHIHTLIVKPDAEDPNDVDLFEYEIRCPDLTDACRMWVECPVANCSIDNCHDSDAVHHGQRHQYVASTWIVPTYTCYVAVADEMPDAAAFLVTKANLGAGEYEVGHNFDEGMVADLHLPDPVLTASGSYGEGVDRG